MSDAKDIAMQVLRDKHENGKVAEIHKQIFFDLEKDKCIVCDMKSDEYFRLYVKEAKRMAISSQAMMEVSAISADRLSNRLARPYNPKSVPSPVEVTCKCGHKDKVGYESTLTKERQVGGPVLPAMEIDDYECSACWWNNIGQFK